MVKNSERENEDINKVRDSLENLESKFDELVLAIEKNNLIQNGIKTKVKYSFNSINEYEGIVADDAYNTQPINSLTHNYSKNYRMFRNDIFNFVMKSKMFWVMLVMLPAIITFIEFILVGWRVTNDFANDSFFTRVALDLINWFALMPILLLSLIVFPTFIAMSRENNQLKRYSMKGMSRKQIYWAYIRFTILFLLFLILIWMTLWMVLLNVAVNSIWMSEGAQVHMGREHLFKTPWDIFFGDEYWLLHRNSTFNINDITWKYNVIVKSGIDNTDTEYIFDLISKGEIDTSNWVTREEMYEWIFGSHMDGQAFMSFFDSIGETFNWKDWLEARAIIDEMPNTMGEAIAQEILNPITGEFNLSGNIKYATWESYEGISAGLFFPFLLLFIFGVNSVGFNKAMKVTSSRSLMGWGIGLWLFASVVQMTTPLLYKEIYAFNSIDGAWNYVVLVLLLILKWMFILSPVTIMMVGMTLATGLIEQPEVMVIGQLGNTFIDFANNNILLVESNFALSDIYHKLVIMKQNEYNPLITPQLTTYLFITMSLLCSLWWTIKTWMSKSKIVSYEAAR